jgi:hypothetical protein
MILGDNVNKNKKYYLAIFVPILLVLLYLLYRNTFFKRSETIKETIDYQKQLELKNIKTCYQLENDYQFKLCDYYIASSFMTPSLGNLHYDYVGIEAIIQTIKSGARFIQLPICQLNVEIDSPPVIATAEEGKKVITSLNTLDIRPTLQEIKKHAFKKMDETSLNYPLFIHLNLHTDNPHTLNKLADIILDEFENKLVLPKPYYKYPIALEKLCNLVNKVVFFSTRGYADTKLKKIVVPTTRLYQELNYQDLGKYDVDEEEFNTETYGNLLSSKIQERNHQHFKDKYSDIQEKITSENEDNPFYLKDEIKSDDKVIRQLNSFNKLGLTIVTPNQSNDVIPSNFDFMEAFSYGCQFVLMNYSKKDKHMNNYIDIFKETSFRLKPARLRFEKMEIVLPDTNSDYESETILSSSPVTKLNTPFLNNYINKVITIQSIAVPNNYLTSVESNLLFETVVNSKDLTLKNCFIVKKGNQGGDTPSIYLQSIHNLKMIVTVNDDEAFYLQPLRKNLYHNQHFYPILPLELDSDDSYNDTTSNTVLLQLTEPRNKKYLTYYNKLVKATHDDNSASKSNNITFKIEEHPHQILIQFITLNGKGIVSYQSGNVTLTEGGVSKSIKFILQPVNHDKLNLIGDSFFLQNSRNNKYLKVNTDGFLTEEVGVNNQESSSYRFLLIKEKGLYSLQNQEQYLNHDDTVLKFKNKSESIGVGKLFKIKINYQLM